MAAVSKTIVQIGRKSDFKRARTAEISANVDNFKVKPVPSVMNTCSACNIQFLCEMSCRPIKKTSNVVFIQSQRKQLQRIKGRIYIVFIVVFVMVGLRNMCISVLATLNVSSAMREMIAVKPGSSSSFGQPTRRRFPSGSVR